MGTKRTAHHITVRQKIWQSDPGRFAVEIRPDFTQTVPPAPDRRTVQRDSDRIPKNVLGGPLLRCSNHPLTGFFRDGCCNTGAEDAGEHIVCTEVTAEFLAFSSSRGNDLITPRPEFGFSGLKPGDRWCLCALRWVEALQAGAAPRLLLAATHENMLEYVPLAELKKYALDLN
jgi:uncharacterized protein (DUF2237 family)